MFLQSNSKDFDKFAEDVVESFITNATPLDDAIVKLANDKSLLPEEIKRVAEKTNTLATIKLIKQAQDGDLTFTLADANKILERSHPETSFTPEVKAPEDAPASLGEMINTLKTASDADAYFQKYLPGKEKTAGDKQAGNGLKEVFKLKKDIEEFGRQKVAAELSFKKAADTLLAEFNNYYAPDFQKFASEVYTIYGESSLPLVEALAADIREPVKLEKVAGYIDDINNKQLGIFKTAHTAISDVCDLTQKIVVAKAQLKEAWDTVKSSAKS